MIVPSVGLPPGAPSVALHVALLLTNQFTPAAPPPATVAVHSSDMPAATVWDCWPPDVHAMELMAAAGRMIMVAVPVRLVCTCATAVMVTTLLVGTFFGAVYSPFVSIVPTVELPLGTVFTCQFTSVLLRFEIVAVHCTVPFTFTEELAQEATMVGAAAGVPPPQETRTSDVESSVNPRMKRFTEVPPWDGVLNVARTGAQSRRTFT